MTERNNTEEYVLGDTEVVVSPEELEQMMREYVQAEETMRRLGPKIVQALREEIPDELKTDLVMMPGNLLHGSAGHEWQNRHMAPPYPTRPEVEIGIEKLKRAWARVATVESEEWSGIGGGIRLGATRKKFEGA